MGTTSWSAKDWTTYAGYTQTVRSATAPSQVFHQNSIHPDMDPSKFLVRESRNSAANPASTPVWLFLDTTSSMGNIAMEIAKNGLGTLIKEIFDRKPISDPHIGFGGIGDVLSDSHCFLQASQMESDITILEQLQKLCVAGGGGGNYSESYTLAWHMAAFHTSTDAYEKDGKKGFLFTFGDDGVPPDLTSQDLEKVYSRKDEVLLSNAELLFEASKMYEVFHLMIKEGSTMSPRVQTAWQKILGERAIPVSDYKKLGEIIVSIMQVVGGENKNSVVNSWIGNTSIAVRNAVQDLSSSVNKTNNSFVRF